MTHIDNIPHIIGNVRGNGSNCNLRLDGNNDSENYKNNTVIQVSSTGKPKHIKRWFTKNHKNISIGNYFLKNDSLFFETKSENGIVIYKGKFKNSPFRTYIGPWYQGGFSDHFPVFTVFEKDE